MAITEQQVLSSIRVGDRVWFETERIGYTVQARSDRWIVCTKPFAPAKTVIYSIIDTDELERGPDNLVFSFGYETREQCEENLQRLVAGEMELSYRRKKRLDVRKTYGRGAT